MCPSFRSTARCTVGILLAAVLGCREDIAPTAPAAEPALAVAEPAAALSFRQVSAGDAHTCGVTTGNRAYCWGDNGFTGLGGQLGDGTTTDRLKPVPVAGGLSFRQVSSGVGHSCGVTTDNRAYCWGRNDAGQLGDGTSTTRLSPVAVAGGRRFRQISAGDHHTCAVTPNDVAFCWGSNRYGVLGVGTFSSPTPARVLGGLDFRSVSAGFSHTCGTTTSDRAYCWGNGTNGQLGDGTGMNRQKPFPVAGGLRFRTVFAGSGYISPASSDEAPDHAVSCGLTADDRAYCWGSGVSSSTPIEPEGDRRYQAVTAGTQICGVNLVDNIFCWSSSPPVRVPAGSVRFSGLSASGIGRHVCAVSEGNRAYCWGDNAQGQLGDGTTTDRPAPVPVVEP